MLSLSSVFKDILPGYRIRDLTDMEEEVKVTKAVQKLRDYERTLVKAFQSYVKLLRGMLNSKTASMNHKRCDSSRPPAACATIFALLFLEIVSHSVQLAVSMANPFAVFARSGMDESFA